METRRIPRRTAVLAACLALAAALASAADNPGVGAAAEAPIGAPRSDTYGTATTTNYVLQSFAFEPAAGDGASTSSNSFGSRYCLTSCTLEAPVMLPAGARIEAIELEACDTNATAKVDANLIDLGALESSAPTLASVTTGIAETPGCSFFLAPVPGGHTVDNLNNTYLAQVALIGGTSATRFQAVRIIYRLQVSPAPVVATFPNDVPTTHPFFRFVEALGRAGISGGCAPGSFCPDAPVTRGQMAVFLATALGLHFPN